MTSRYLDLDLLGPKTCCDGINESLHRWPKITHTATCQNVSMNVEYINESMKHTLHLGAHFPSLAANFCLAEDKLDKVSRAPLPSCREYRLDRDRVQLVKEM